MDLLHNKLQLATQTTHAQIEKIPLLRKIITQSITLPEYHQLIKKFYGFIAPCEAECKHSPHQLHFADREKTPLIEQDLVTFGITEQSRDNISRCSQLPSLSEYENILGYLYVMEGSTLGGMIITQHLQHHLQLTPDQGLRYFYGYGSQTKMMWKTFCETLNRVTDSQQQNKIIQSAQATFHSLYQWMLI